jgi:hypothetical protein
MRKDHRLWIGRHENPPLVAEMARIHQKEFEAPHRSFRQFPQRTGTIAWDFSEISL